MSEGGRERGQGLGGRGRRLENIWRIPPPTIPGSAPDHECIINNHVPHYPELIHLVPAVSSTSPGLVSLSSKGNQIVAKIPTTAVWSLTILWLI